MGISPLTSMAAVREAETRRLNGVSASTNSIRETAECPFADAPLSLPKNRGQALLEGGIIRIPAQRSQLSVTDSFTGPASFPVKISWTVGRERLIQTVTDIPEPVDLR
jgi:hypothetical protein